MYSERVWQGYVGQDVLVDVGLTWRVSPEVSKGRARRTKVSTPPVGSHCEKAVGGDKFNVLIILETSNKTKNTQATPFAIPSLQSISYIDVSYRLVQINIVLFQ